MWIYSFYSMADGFFVAWGVGPMALASVNIAMPFINFIFGLSILFASGASTAISIYIGAGDEKSARDAFMTNLVFLLAVGLAIAFFSASRAGALASLLGATESLAEGVSDYLRIIARFSVFFIITYFLEMMSRVDGYPRLATSSVALAGIVNVALDYLFVIKFGWGIKGAAYATGIAQTLPAIMLAAHVKFRGRKLAFSRFSFDFSCIRRGLGLGFGDSVTEFSVGFAIFIFNRRILEAIGEAGVVSYTVVAYVSTLVVMTMSGIAQGMMQLSSYSHGKQDSAAVGKILALALKTALACGIAWFALSGIFAPQVASAFIDADMAPELHSSTVRAFRLYAASYAVVGANVVMGTFFSTVERPLCGMAIASCRGIVALAISLYAMSELFGNTGIWLSPLVSEILCAAFGAILFIKRVKSGGNG
jgi:Na+-driven multidrug efflux pump